MKLKCYICNNYLLKNECVYKNSLITNLNIIKHPDREDDICIMPHNLKFNCKFSCNNCNKH